MLPKEKLFTSIAAAVNVLFHFIFEKISVVTYCEWYQEMNTLSR